MSLSEHIGNAEAVAFLGMCKNAGKTTALCRLLREYAVTGETAALTSIGRDGESRDLVTGTEKPPIYMYAGMLAATAEGLLPFCDVSREILDLPEIYTSLGRVVIFRAKSDGYVQLAGPAMVEQLTPLRARLAELGASRTLVDGALSRVSPAAAVPSETGCCVLSTGASLDRDMERVVRDTAFTARLLTLPATEAPGASADRFTLFRNGEVTGAADAAALNTALKRGRGGTVLLSGALTESQAGLLLRGGGRLAGLTLLAEDGSRYLLRRETFERLEALGLRFAVRRTVRLAAVTVNPVSAGGWRFDAGAFLKTMAGAVEAPVLDVGHWI